jgi:argininosuccinate synthase
MVTAINRVVLAYSGGLDTSVAIPWIRETYGAEVIALTVDLGQGRELQAIRQKALNTGAAKAVVVDGKKAFFREFVWPSLQAGAMYEGRYPLATALARPLIARALVEEALAEGANAVAHGCTGKGNDQVRFDVAVMSLAPQLQVIAPAREWGMSREEEMEYARKRGIPVPTTAASPFSVDENLWGRSIEAGILEDPWLEPPEEVYAWTKSVAAAPEKPAYLELGFRHGLPVSLNGSDLEPLSLVSSLNEIAGEHGVGRIDHLENRLVGIKSREIYEAPAAMVLHVAHQALESLTLAKEQQRFKEVVVREYAELVYNGAWYSSHLRDLDAYVASTQQFVSGVIRIRLHKGNCTVVGRHSPQSLYSYELATYDKDDQFDHHASEGFIKVYGLPAKTQARKQPREHGVKRI